MNCDHPLGHLLCLLPIFFIYTSLYFCSQTCVCILGPRYLFPCLFFDSVKEMPDLDSCLLSFGVFILVECRITHLSHVLVDDDCDVSFYCQMVGFQLSTAFNNIPHWTHLVFLMRLVKIWSAFISISWWAQWFHLCHLCRSSLPFLFYVLCNVYCMALDPSHATLSFHGRFPVCEGLSERRLLT